MSPKLQAEHIAAGRKRAFQEAAAIYPDREAPQQEWNKFAGVHEADIRRLGHQAVSRAEFSQELKTAGQIVEEQAALDRQADDAPVHHDVA